MVDVDAQVAAVTRIVSTAEHDGAELRRQTLTQQYPSSLDDVWDAITSPERIARWFLRVEGDLRLGGHYQLVGNAGGTIESCEPPRDGGAAYRVTWEYGGAISWLTVSLHGVHDTTTRLELAHTARVADVSAEFWELYGPGATGVGWDSGLLGLALHLKGGDGIAPEEAETWMLSGEGNRFARAAADAWADAQTADGGDRDAAARAADATFGFYTGQAHG